MHFFISSSKNHFLFLRKTANIISFTTIKIEMPANLMRSRLKMTSEIGQKMASLDLRTALQLLYSFYEWEVQHSRKLLILWHWINLIALNLMKVTWFTPSFQFSIYLSEAIKKDHWVHDIIMWLSTLKSWKAVWEWAANYAIKKKLSALTVQSRKHSQRCLVNMAS